MKNKVLISILLISLILLVGCGQKDNNPNQEPIKTTEQPPINTSIQTQEVKQEPIKPKSTELKDLILQESEMPQGWALSDRRERLRTDVSEESLQNGWKRGYLANFIKGTGLTIGNIDIWISEYSKENINKILTSHSNKEGDTEVLSATTVAVEYTYEPLAVTNIGDRANLYKYTKVYRGANGETYEGYRLELIKGTYYVGMENYGAIKDVETLKDLAKKQADKL